MAKGKFSPMGMGGGNMNQMIKQAQKMQQDMLKAQEELENLNVEASSGGGAVIITANAKKEIISVKIKPEVVDPDDVEMLEDLIVSAINEVNRKADEESNNLMGKITGSLNLPGMF